MPGEATGQTGQQNTQPANALRRKTKRKLGRYRWRTRPKCQHQIGEPISKCKFRLRDFESRDFPFAGSGLARRLIASLIDDWSRPGEAGVG